MFSRYNKDGYTPKNQHSTVYCGIYSNALLQKNPFPSK